MQKPISTVQFSTPNGAPPARGRAVQEADSGQFRQAMTRELAQRQQAAPVKAPAPDAAPKQVAKQDKGAAPKPAAAAEQAREPEQARASEGAERSRPADEAEEAEEAADAAAASPMEAMLALVASFNQPLALADGGAPARPADGQAAAQSADGKTFNMMVRMDGAPLDVAPGGRAAPAGKAQPAAAADPAPADGGDLPDVAATDFGRLLQRQGGAEPVATEPGVSAPLSAAVQQASLATAQTAVAASSDRIPARVGTPDWDNQVAQKIIYMVGGQDMSASLTLNPPDLGPMQVVLNVNNDHADVSFMSGQPEVRQALEEALPKLREMLSESGIALGNASVSDGARQQSGDEPARGARGGSGANTQGSAAEAEAQLAARPLRSGELPGLVNTFA